MLEVFVRRHVVGKLPPIVRIDNELFQMSLLLFCRGARTGQSKQYAVEKYRIELRVYYLEATEVVGTQAQATLVLDRYVLLRKVSSSHVPVGATISQGKSHKP